MSVIELYRGSEELEANTALDKITDVLTCELHVEPVADQLWPFVLKTPKQVYVLAVQTEAERSEWLVAILKQRPIAALMALLHNPALAYFAAMSACLLAVESTDATAALLSSKEHLQLLYSYCEKSNALLFQDSLPISLL